LTISTVSLPTTRIDGRHALNLSYFMLDGLNREFGRTAAILTGVL
jgi:hypothetical protein